MHVFPQLRRLEKKYAAELAVVGVHSAKFNAEKSTENIRQAVLRYRVEHPVVNDKDFALWQQYTVRAWPTLMFIDPEGKVIGRHEGEVPFDAFDQTIGDMIRQFDERGLIDRRAVQYTLERDKELDGPLSFPGKVLADAESGRLFIADSNHHRIVIASLEGKVLSTVGSEQAGFQDGGFGEARFNHPQGMALDGNILYVADTENHAIRQIDLANQNVKTIAGTGDQAMTFHRGGDAGSVALNSPWDLTFDNGTLYIAMAGFHQLWSLDLGTHTIRPHAGNGRENIVDGPLESAQLAQPSGVTTDGRLLYFTDSETSSVRTAAIDPGGEVKTIVGVDLFVFGDVDDFGDNVRLQHPIGIAFHEGALFIADAYNNKVKKIDPATREATTFLGTGEPGRRDGQAREAELHEPGGLSAARGKLYIADTNNHAIRVADLASGEVSTLELN